MSKAAKLVSLFNCGQTQFMLGVHDALSAKIAQETGFPGIWVSGLGLSAVSGLRDSNELSWTQVMERVELIAERVTVPALVDIDSGYGDFNNVRLVARRLGRLDVGGACIEDKLFPKTNSFIGSGQELANPVEFCGRIKAAKDTAGDSMVLVARCEALVSGHPMSEALDRCNSYREAGADAILIHSKQSSIDEIAEFMRHWGRRAPVAIVPTKYSHVQPETLEELGIAVSIWANQSLRASILGMQHLAHALWQQRTMADLESKIAALGTVFELTDNEELESAKLRYANFA